MTDKTTKLITFLYKEKFGERVTSVKAINGTPPSENNTFLFNPVFNQFEGVVQTEDGGKFVFFLSKEGKTWKLNSRKI